MVTDILALGNKIEMHRLNMSLKSEKSEPDKVYVSQILEFDEDDEDVLYIAMPIYEGKLVPLEVGGKHELHFYAKRGIYECECEVTNRYKSNNIYVLVVKLLTDLKKYQRRQFFRLETNMEFRYKIFEEEDEKYFRTMGKMSDEMLDRPFATGITLDISGGGMRFVSKDRLNRGDKIQVLLNLKIDEEFYPCEAIAVVISSGQARGKENVCENRIEFVQIKDSERELLIKYIFREERNIRKRQLE